MNDWVSPSENYLTCERFGQPIKMRSECTDWRGERGSSLGFLHNGVRLIYRFKRNDSEVADLDFTLIAPKSEQTLMERISLTSHFSFHSHHHAIEGAAFDELLGAL